MPPKDNLQNKACQFLPITSPFRGLPTCFQCQPVGSRGSRRTKADREEIEAKCAFKGRRTLIDEQVSLISGESATPSYPSTWDRRPTLKEAKRALRQVSEQLLPILKAELAHTEEIYVLPHPKPLWFRRELIERVVCDICRTTLFAGAFICEDCGREWCSQCDTERSPTCTNHTTKPRRVSRFADREEISTAIAQMEDIIAKNKLPGVPEGEQQNRCYPTLEWRVDNHDDWRDFMDCLRRGAPLVVKNSTKAFQRQYDFEYFAHALKGRTIVAIHVLDGREQEKDAFDFFMSIARGDQEANLWKIKDFPPENAFKEFFEPVAQDLEQNWAFRSYVSLNGVLNCMSRIPNNEGVPKSDVGPKLYNSPAIPVCYGKASTALHMDMMDALNVSLFTAKSSKSSPQDDVAVWHIFPANSCDKLRDYLDSKYQNDPNRPPGDVIHGQWVYLTDDMLKELKLQTGVRPWVILQAPGDTVFIPSRCPHQVRNCVWTIKAAIDFLSGEALLRTAKVAEELRHHRFVNENLEDVLQLPLVLWHAWVSLNRELPDITKMHVMYGKRKGRQDSRGDRKTVKLGTGA